MFAGFSVSMFLCGEREREGQWAKRAPVYDLVLGTHTQTGGAWVRAMHSSGTCLRIFCFLMLFPSHVPRPVLCSFLFFLVLSWPFLSSLVLFCTFLSFLVLSCPIVFLPPWPLCMIMRIIAMVYILPLLFFVVLTFISFFSFLCREPLVSTPPSHIYYHSFFFLTANQWSPKSTSHLDLESTHRLSHFSEGSPLPTKTRVPFPSNSS